ncbi:MAG: DUF4230 domain-containing protein [Clostridia bacterium]|nr:DUF4230 domain-containing protein [Clostridia bacterium]
MRRRNIRRPVWPIVVTIAVVVVAAVVAGFILGNQTRPDKTLDVTTISLTVKEVLNASDLVLAEYPYQGIAFWTETKNDRTENIMKISYEGLVRPKIDFKKITVTPSEDQKKVVISLPSVENSYEIDQTKMQYVYYSGLAKDKYGTPTYFSKIVEICEKDLEDDFNASELIKKSLMDSIKTSVIEIVRPFYLNMNVEFVVEIGGEEA